MIDARGNPLNFTLRKANRHDQVKVLETIDGIRIGKRRRRPKRLGLDKGYDSDPLRQALRRRRIVPLASYRRNRKRAPHEVPLSGVGFLPKEKQRRHSSGSWNPAIPHCMGPSAWTLACAGMTDRRSPARRKPGKIASHEQNLPL